MVRCSAISLINFSKPIRNYKIENSLELYDRESRTGGRTGGRANYIREMQNKCNDNHLKLLNLTFMRF